MDSGMQTRQSHILRVGKDLLVLLEITVLSNKNTENISWFTDTEMLELLMLVRDPVCKRVEEYAQQQPEMKRRRRGTSQDSGMKVQPPVMLTGQHVKLGVQFMKHHVSRTCLLPKESPGPLITDESSNHSGGGFDALFLFPEKVQVIVCEYLPLTGISNENQQTSSYFEPTKTGSEKDKTQTNTAKKKQLQLKRIVSASAGTSVCKKSTLHGGFETSLVPSRSTSTPSCQQKQGKEKPNSCENASSPSSSENEMAAATVDVDNTSAIEHKNPSNEARDVYSFDSESDHGRMELKRTPQKKHAKESEMSNSVKDCLSVSVPHQGTPPKCLLESAVNRDNLNKNDTLKSGEGCGVIAVASGTRQSKLSLKRDRKNRDNPTVLDNVEVEQLTGVRPLETRILTDSDTDIPADPTDLADPTTSSLSGKKRKWESTTLDNSPAKLVAKPNEEQPYSAIPESCNSPVKVGKSVYCAPNGKQKRRKLTKKLSQSHRSFDISSSDEEESFNIDVFRLKNNRKKLGKKTLINSEGDIPKESVKETEAVTAKRHDESDNALSSDEGALPSANFLKSTGALTQEETEEETESSKEGRVSPTFDRLMKNSKADGVSKTKKQSKVFQYQTISNKKRTRRGNSSKFTSQPLEGKRDDKSSKEFITHSDSDVPVPTYLIEESNEAEGKEGNLFREEYDAVDGGLGQNKAGTENTSLNIAGHCQTSVSACQNKHVRKRTILSPGEKEHFDENSFKDKTCQDSLDFDDDSLPELENVSDGESVQGSIATAGKIFSFHDNSKFCVKDVPVTQGGERNKGENCEVSSKSSQDDFLSDDHEQENICSSPGLKNPKSNRRNFFQVDDYENVQSQSDGTSFDLKFNKASRKKKAPLKAKNSQNGGTFGSLKRFDDTTASKKSKNSSSRNRRCSQIQVTPQNLDKWWLPKDGKRKERKSEVVDLVAMEEKMEEALKLVKSVSELTEEQLRYLTQNNEDYLQAIFQGKKPCHRHQEYKSSSALRTRMTYLVSYGDFPEDSLETIMDSLVPMFCKKGSKYLDYVSKVLLPELLVKICMDVLHVNYEEAEKMF